MEVIGAGPSGRSLKTLNNKNNLADLYLKKRLDQYHREKSFSLSHMDRDKFDTRDFLKRINTIESDKHQAAIQYLGRKPVNHVRRSKTVLNKCSPQTFPITSKDLFYRTSDDEQTQMDDDIKPSTVPTAFGFYRESPSPSPLPLTRTMPSLHIESPASDTNIAVETPAETSNQKDTLEPRLSTTLPSVNRRGSVYLQIAAVADNPSEFSVSSEEADTDINKPAKMSTRRKSFLAWINDKKNPVDGLLPSFLKKQPSNPAEKRRNSFLNWLKRREDLKNRRLKTDIKSLHGIFEEETEGDLTIEDDRYFQLTARSDVNNINTTSGMHKGKQVGDVMQSFVYMKNRKRDPLDVRLKKFYKTLETLKISEI